MLTLSVVSHGQGRIVARLLDDLARIASPRVSRVIVTRNITEDWRPPERIGDCEIVLIDNAQPRGFGANHNAAFEHCRSEYFAVVNPDILLPQDPFTSIEQQFTSDPKLGLLSPCIKNPDGQIEDFVRAQISPLSILLRRISSRTEHREDWVAGMFMVFRSAAFRSVHGFDSRFFMYCEDADICARLRLAQWKFTVAWSCDVIHDAQRASHRSAQHLRWHLTSMLRMWASSAFWRYRALLSRDRGKELN